MKKRILSLCMAAVLALSCIVPAWAAETQSGLTVRSVTPTDLSQTMGNTTQQMTAQPQNPNEVVDILVELDDEPAAAVLAAQSLTPGTAAAEKTAAKVQQTLLRRQATVQSRLDRSLRQEQVDYTYSYTMLFNGFALRTARKNLETIQSAKGVSRAFVAGSYTLPTVEQADTQALQVALATNQFTGKGMTIAVLDTGLDTAHPAFANAPADAKFTKDYISGVLQAADLNAEALMPGVTSSDVVLYTDADQYGDTKPVLNLGDDVARNGSYDLTFHARNMGKDAAQYDVSVIAMSPAVLTQDGKTYMSSHDEALDVTVSGDKTVTLAAGATGDVKVSVSLSQSQKAKLDAAYENGIYVEGFVVLTAKDGSADLSIPFLAYYGDWSAPGMLDYATMLNEDTVPYSQLST